MKEIFMLLISLHKRTKLSPPYHGRKTPTKPKRKKARSHSAFDEIPQGGKSEQGGKKKKNTLSHQYFLEPGAVLVLHGSPRQLSFV